MCTSSGSKIETKSGSTSVSADDYPLEAHDNGRRCLDFLLGVGSSLLNPLEVHHNRSVHKHGKEETSQSLFSAIVLRRSVTWSETVKTFTETLVWFILVSTNGGPFGLSMDGKIFLQREDLRTRDCTMVDS